jgi:hypothetical protein
MQFTVKNATAGEHYGKRKSWRCLSDADEHAADENDGSDVR